MEVLTKTELRLRLEEILTKIKNGAIFIHPTDTIYGISCNALNHDAVKKVRDLKERPDTPFSVWVPSLAWIKKNCKTTPEINMWLERLPGPYTLIFDLNNSEAIAKNVNPKSSSLGVRVPEHWFGNLVKELNFPLITTSVNKSGHAFMTCLENLDPEIEMAVDFMIYEGEKKAKPSKIVNFTNGTIKER
jgi:L-threonylcarbamoyladenylate synthase